ncbi:unnamed protein product [Trichobilharzia regenti]|nr:unnamed protein product [Trichobilharzia regenti]
MHFIDILKCWEECKSSENYDSLPSVINAYIQSSNHRIDITSADDVKSLNSLIAAGFCDEYSEAIQDSILDLIMFFGKYIQTRYQLLTYFSILKPLIYGVISDSTEYNKLKEDFEALRNCLLRIISSDQVSRSALVFSVAVRFHLWNSADKVSLMAKCILDFHVTPCSCFIEYSFNYF